jgi:hypothetical protein
MKPKLNTLSECSKRLTRKKSYYWQRKEEFPGWRIFQDLSDLPSEGVYADITKHFAVSLQSSTINFFGPVPQL